MPLSYLGALIREFEKRTQIENSNVTFDKEFKLFMHIFKNVMLEKNKL